MKTDKYGFYVMDDEVEVDYTSTDDDNGDLSEKDGTPWWEEDGVEEEDSSGLYA